MCPGGLGSSECGPPSQDFSEILGLTMHPSSLPSEMTGALGHSCVFVSSWGPSPETLILTLPPHLQEMQVTEPLAAPVKP